MKNPYPLISNYVKTYKEYKELKVKLIIGDDLTVPYNALKDISLIDDEHFGYYDGTIVNFSNPVFRKQIIDLLRTPLIPNQAILLNDAADLKILPSNPYDYLIGSPIKSNSITVTPQLNEVTLNQLIQNNYKYKLNWKTRKFQLLDESEYIKYFLKNRIRSRLVTYTGDVLDRIADLSEMILRLSYQIESIKSIEDEKLLSLLDTELEIKNKINEIIDKSKLTED